MGTNLNRRFPLPVVALRRIQARRQQAMGFFAGLGADSIPGGFPDPIPGVYGDYTVPPNSGSKAGATTDTSWQDLRSNTRVVDSTATSTWAARIRAAYDRVTGQKAAADSAIAELRSLLVRASTLEETAEAKFSAYASAEGRGAQEGGVGPKDFGGREQYTRATSAITKVKDLVAYHENQYRSLQQAWKALTDLYGRAEGAPAGLTTEAVTSAEGHANMVATYAGRIQTGPREALGHIADAETAVREMERIYTVVIPAEKEKDRRDWWEKNNPGVPYDPTAGRGGEGGWLQAGMFGNLKWVFLSGLVIGGYYLWKEQRGKKAA